MKSMNVTIIRTATDADGDAVVGDDDGIGDEDPLHDLRHAALLLAEEKEDHRVEKEGDRGGEQHGALLPGRAADHGTEEETLDQRADPHQGQAGGCERHHERKTHLPVDGVGNEAAEHVHLAVREVEHVHQGEDEREAERDQRVLRAEVEPVDNHLRHLGTPRRR